MGTIWVVVIAGHLYTAPNGQSYYNNPRACTNVATVVGGRCVEMPAPAQQPPNDGGFALYQQCVAVGACK